MAKQSKSKKKRRGFVMTGGGAKGLYEAGVIHAFHITGMEFDIITGSSIGAMNSVFFADYLLRKRRLDKKIQEDPERAVDAMDALVKAYHHAWLSMPEKHIIDDSEKAPLGKLINDLLKFDIKLPDLVEIGWWYTNPNRYFKASPAVWAASLRVLNELMERIGGFVELLRIVKFNRQEFIEEALRTYLRKFDLERSLIPTKDDQRIKEVFTEPISPLTAEHLSKGMSAGNPAENETFRLVDPNRTFREYAEVGLDVRLTRANYRTGRLEISAYMTAEDFVRYMKNQAWRLDVSEPEKMPLGSFRLQLPGNPNAIRAAVASGRFPGVFAAYPFTEIYPSEDPENELLYQLLTSWFEDAKTEDKLHQAFQKVVEDEEFKKSWKELLTHWQKSENIQSYFPHLNDTYVDGGAIDNTPSNSAIDATREWIEAEGESNREVLLDLFIIFLDPEPKVDYLEDEDPALYQVVGRTLKIQGAAKRTSDAVVVETINTFGKRADALGQALLALMDSSRETLNQLTPNQTKALEKALRETASERGLRGYLGDDSDGILNRMNAWARNLIREKLPLHVNEIKIYPEIMPLGTLQFTERLGYRQENAIKMLTMGCYNTLWALRTYLEESNNDKDKQDQQVLAMTQKWMGIEEWSKGTGQDEALRQNWNCKRTACVFHAKHCPHGARPGKRK